MNISAMLQFLRKDTMIKIGVGFAIVLVVYILMRMSTCKCKDKHAVYITPAPAMAPLGGYETPVQTYLAPVGEGYAEYPTEDYQDWEEEEAMEEEYMDSPHEFAKPNFKTDLLS
jgi:hypothetical protein